MAKGYIQIDGIKNEHGLVIDLFLNRPEPPTFFEKLSRAKPQPKKIRAVIDTGAVTSVLCTSVIEELGLKSKSYIVVRVVGGERLVCLTYPAAVMYQGINSDGGWTTRTEILSLPSAVLRDKNADGPQALIGRDILDRCELTYQGFNSAFKLKVFF